MRRQKRNLTIGLSLAGLFFAVVMGVGAEKAFAEASAADGVWDCVSATPDGGEFPFTLTVKEDGGKLTATAGSDQGQIPLTNVELNGDQLSFVATLNDEDYSVKVTVKGDTLEGEWSGGGDSGSVKGKRRA
jgi:hypothetical protein